MSITKSKFGKCNGADVYEYTLENGKGLKARILSLGGIIRTLEYKGVDVVLGRDSAEEYERNSGYFGAVIGRNSNRIAGAKFTLGGKTYTLNANNGANNIHGGLYGFDKKIWEATESDGDEPSLVLSTVSPDGEEGFPGNAQIRVTYTVTSKNSLRIHYVAVSDADTVMNLTNHSYFNLNGHDRGTIEGHTLWLDADFYTPNSNDCIPTGEVLSVSGTPFDFSTPETIGERLAMAHPQTELFKGFDHNFALNGTGYRKVGVLKGDKSGIAMEVYTDRPAVQIYTANGMDNTRVCKGGALYSPHGAICLETQAFPDNLRRSHFPSAVLKKGEIFSTVTEYLFI